MDKRPAKPAKTPKTGAKPERKSVMLELDTHRILDKSAKKLKLSNGEYVSAAIAYFAQTGLDPTKDQPVSLASVSMKVDEVERNVRKQNHEIGTRLVQIIRTWEKNSYTFMQQQQASTNNYLELIESNLLQHQVAVETNLLAPMVEQLFKGNIEAYMARVFASYLYVKSTDLPAGSDKKQLERSNSERDEQLAIQLQAFLKTNSVPLPKPTARRAVTPAPTKPVAAKPVPPASPAPAGAAKS
jgi:hypothetical protein